MKRRIVIKIGSNVLTREDGKLDVTRMSALVDQVAWLRMHDIEVILVSSGAVACGRRELTVDHSLDSVEQRQLFSAVGQVKLVGLYYDLFREFGIHVGQVLTMKENFRPGEQYRNQQACMTVMLENDVLPIVNENDTVSVTELMFTDKHKRDMQLKETFERVKRASKSLALLTDTQRNDILNAVADAIIAQQERILKANAQDLAKMDQSNPLYDRLQLTESRLEGIASDMRNVATLPTPLGHITKEKTLPNGLRLCRISVPFGVIGMIYEARPNVTFDVFSLCFKSGNACVLKGGKDADCSNREEVALIHEVLEQYGVSEDVVALLPATHEATGEMLNAVGYIDLCIPRGGRKLIDFVRDTARVPVIETGAGVVNTYFDKDGDLEMGKAIINNAKTRRVSVCNALDCLLVHLDRLDSLDQLVKPLAEKNVIIYADEQAYAVLDGQYPYLEHATEDSFGTEFMDYKLAIKTVASLEEAIAHIDENGSGHSEAIITMNEAAARKFQAHVDAACVYWNAPTSFTDGAQFGLGAEIGISTQKLGPRGPMALEEICTYKWLIEGEGQIRK